MPGSRSAFSEYAIDLRNMLGVKQKDMAHILGISQAAICRWEKGKNTPEASHRLLVMTLFMRATKFRRDAKWLKGLGQQVVKDGSLGLDSLLRGLYGCRP